MSASGDTIGHLLARHRSGDACALDELVSLVYGELRRLAAWQMRGERDDHTLQPTALVHEAFIRLVDAHDLAVKDRAHFFAVAARVMRNVLVDHARARRAEKRGGAAVRVELDDVVEAATEHGIDVLAVSEALEQLANVDSRLVEIVELRYFAGLTIPEIAEVLAVSQATVERDWVTARAWLRTQLS